MVPVEVVEGRGADADTQYIASVYTAGVPVYMVSSGMCIVGACGRHLTVSATLPLIAGIYIMESSTPQNFLNTVFW